LDSVKQSSPEIISVRDIEHRYGNIHALHVKELSISDNDLTAIVGPNGGGKSTLLKILAGIIKPAQGKVIRHNQIPLAYLPQNTQIDRTFPMRVEDVVAMGLWRNIRSFGRINQEFRQQIKMSLELVGLKGFEHRSLYELSGGQLLD
jgi:zinc/manganese transport system ATP-binding protein